MKRHAFLLTLSLMALPGCRDKKEKEKVEKTRDLTPEPLFHHIEYPSDTTLPQEVKTKEIPQS